MATFLSCIKSGVGRLVVACLAILAFVFFIKRKPKPPESAPPLVEQAQTQVQLVSQPFEVKKAEVKATSEAKEEAIKKIESDPDKAAQVKAAAGLMKDL